MAQATRYGNVPDLDDAPDIYETPELTDDTSTIPASATVRSHSSASSYDDAPEDTSGIVRTRVGHDEARNRFESTRVSARNADFSGKLSQGQKSYRVSSRRRRRFPEDAEELGDFSEEEDEPLEHRLARLRQELEEVRAEIQSREAAKPETADKEEPSDGPPFAEDDVQKLGELLDSVYLGTRGAAPGAEAQYHATLRQFNNKLTAAKSAEPLASIGSSPLPDEGISVEQRTQILSKASEVDQRLTALETMLGLDGRTLPDFSSDAQKPILYTLSSLDRQLATLASSSSADMLDTASHRVRQLTQDADRLAERQQAASSGSPGALSSSRDAAKTNGATTHQEQDHTSKVNALFGTLSTIEGLSPSLPMVLERLRTLRLIHASAGDASKTLDGLEKRQAQQATEIQRWQEALQKVEAGMSEGEGVLTSNVKLVGEWVKELEARVGKLN